MSDTTPGEVPRITVEQRLADIAGFMTTRNISAILIDGRLEDDKPFEGILFYAGDSEAIAEVRFTEGQILNAPIEELTRRFAVPGLVYNLIRPVQRAARAVYAEGGALLDERFDVLARFND